MQYIPTVIGETYRLAWDVSTLGQNHYSVRFSGWVKNAATDHGTGKTFDLVATSESTLLRLYADYAMITGKTTYDNVSLIKL